MFLQPVGCSQEGIVGPGAGCGGQKQLRGCGKTKSGARGDGKSSDYIQQVAIGWGSPGRGGGGRRGHGAPGGRVPPHIGRGGWGSGRRLCQLTGWAYWAHRRKGTSWLGVASPGCGVQAQRGPAWGQEALCPWGLVLEKEGEGNGLWAMGWQGLWGCRWCRMRGAELKGWPGSLSV